MRKTVIIFLVAIVSFSFVRVTNKDKREYYRVTIYHFKSEDQKKELDAYLGNALLPALHKLGIKNVGVFTPIANDTVADKRIVMIYPIRSLAEIMELSGKLSKDEAYQTTGKKFIDAAYNESAYTRMENLILYAFPDAPVLQ